MLKQTVIKSIESIYFLSCTSNYESCVKLVKSEVKLQDLIVRIELDIIITGYIFSKNQTKQL